MTFFKAPMWRVSEKNWMLHQKIKVSVKSQKYKLGLGLFELSYI